MAAGGAAIRSDTSDRVGQQTLRRFPGVHDPGMRNGESYRPFVADFMAPVRALVKPVSEGLFAGALDISKVPTLRNRLMFRLSMLFGVWSEGDHRDWSAIRSWAESLPPKL